MEKSEAARLGVDRLLAKWALEENIIELREDGEYRLTSGPGSGVEEKPSAANAAGHMSDSASKDADEKSAVAAGTAPDPMEVDG